LRLSLGPHIAIWAALNPVALTRNERARPAGADDTLVLSAGAIWELRLKCHPLTIAGGRTGPVGPDTVVTYAVAMG